MRLDKFLKVSRLIRRRTVAADACGAGRVLVNGSARKPGYDVHPGDRIDIILGERTVSAEVLTIEEPRGKTGADEMVRFL